MSMEQPKLYKMFKVVRSWESVFVHLMARIISYFSSGACVECHVFVLSGICLIHVVDWNVS